MTAETGEIRPPQPPSFLQWARQNLFRTWYDTLFTLASAAVVYLALSGGLRWVLYGANWRPVTDNFMLYLVGQYPRPLLWRVGVSLMTVSALLGLSWGVWKGASRTFAFSVMVFFAALAINPIGSLTLGTRLFFAAVPAVIYLGFLLGNTPRLPSRLLVAAWVVSLPVIFYLLRGSRQVPLLDPVGINLWGGLLVTALLAVSSIVISFPIGVLLALGRRSSLPVVSLFSTAFIELVRGVPLISILFLFSLIVPLFLPPDIRFDRLLRAAVAMIVFSAAYMAENVRGGLQAIPAGQYDAARAVGLNNFLITFLVVLPQALRKVIPAIVGQFISLFKDTTLASGVAVLEILSIGRSILQGNPEYLGAQAEVYLFIAAIFWIFSYSMSVASRELEARLGVGQR